ncbi:MAG: polysaccharide biosynthesis C-terminal domain-containing protein [Hyphomicrobiales bacterium]
MRGINSQLIEILKNGIIRGIMSSVGIKAFSAISSFLLFLFAARVLGDEMFGRFSIIFSLASMLAVFAAFGQEMLVIRLWNQYGAQKEYGLLKGGIIFGAAICFVGGLISAIGFAIYLNFTASMLVGYAAGFYVFILTLVMFSSHLARAIVGVFTADGQRDIIALVPTNLFLFTLLIFSLSTSLETIFIIYGLGFVLVLTIQVFAMLKKLKQEPFGAFKGRAKYDLKNWMPTSFKLWVVTMLESSNQYLEVVLIGFLLSPMAAGIYFVATRLANIFLTVADAFNMYGSKHIPDLFYREKHGDLANLLKTMAMMMVLAVVGGLLFFAVAGGFLMSLFSESFSEYYGVLMILCIGTASLAATGAATQMLMLTGHESGYLKVMAASVLIRIVGFFILIPYFDIYGAAFANAISLIFIAIFVSMTTKWLTGHDPSIARLVYRSSVPATKPSEA